MFESNAHPRQFLEGCVRVVALILTKYHQFPSFLLRFRLMRCCSPVLLAIRVELPSELEQSVDALNSFFYRLAALKLIDQYCQS